MLPPNSVRILASHVSHMAFNYVWRDSGVTDKYGLDLTVHVANINIPDQPFIRMRERASSLLRGEYHFVSGLHHAPYVLRARGDKRLVYLAQAQNDWDDRLMAASRIETPRELEGETVIVSTPAPCVYGNLRRSLALAGVDIDAVSFEVWNDSEQGTDVSQRAIDQVVDGSAAGALVDVPFDRYAEKRGLRGIDIPAIPVVHNTTLCTNREWIAQHEERVDHVLRSMVEAIHFFKTKPDSVCSILERELAPLIGITDPEDIVHLQAFWGRVLSPKPYPHPLAIWNVYQLDILHDPESNIVGPMEMWDTGYLRTIDDSGFIDALYGGHSKTASPPVLAVI